MKNIKELRSSLTENYTKVKAGKMKLPLAKELANMAGKIISSCKIEMDYNNLTGQKGKKIDFLESK